MSFDLLAPHYSWMERVTAGPLLQRCRTAWLPALDHCENVLVAGVGHAHFVRALLQRRPGVRVTCLDASAGMLAQARRRLARAGVSLHRVEFLHARLPEAELGSGRFDAVTTHFFLDCFAPEELARVVARLAAAARDDARWLVSDFAVPARGWRRLRARVIHRVMYDFFRVATRLPARRLTPPDGLLTAAGFALEARRRFNHGLLHADCWRRGA